MNNPQTPAHPAKTNEEPELTQEESVPSDGADTEGEEMMKDVRNPRLDRAGEGEKK